MLKVLKTRIATLVKMTDSDITAVDGKISEEFFDTSKISFDVEDKKLD